MTTTDLRETFAAVSDAVAAPPIDRLAFERRLRDARRRRTTSRAAGVVAAVATVALGVGGLQWLGGGSAPGGPDSVEPATQAPAVGAAGDVVLAVGGRLAVLRPDGTLRRSDVGVEEVLARTDSGAVVIGRESELLLVPLDDRGRMGEPIDLVGGAVQRAAVSPDGSRLAFVDLDERVHVRPLAPGATDDDVVPIGGDEALLAVDGDTLLTWNPERARLVVRVGSGRSQRPLHRADPPSGGSLAGGVVAYATGGGVWFFDTDGTARAGDVGGGVGGLSTDGRWYASAPSTEETDRGTPDELSVHDTATGATEKVEGFDGAGSIEAISWLDGDRFVAVVSLGSSPGGVATLLDCSRTALRCEERYTDDTGTLGIATR